LHRAGRPRARTGRGDRNVMDLWMAVATVAFFVAMFGLIRWFDRI
jgi:hypothetical protein